MKVHEYQAKGLLRQYGVAVPNGDVASTPEEASNIAERLGAPTVVKAQIHAGGRGKGGGIALADSPQQTAEAARRIIGMNLVTHQTGPEGRKVNRVLIEEQAKPEREMYLAFAIDSAAGGPVLIGSDEGGVEIEEVASRAPEKIRRIAIDPAVGLQPFYARRLAFDLGLGGELLRPAVELISGLYNLFVEKDCSLAEINPLIVTGDGRILALDAKVNFDDNALFRHPDIQAMRDIAEEDPLEVQAQELGVSNYIKLTGNIGCVVNGAGLAMATMDAITLAGGSPANFLDIGTVNNVDRVVNAFRILTADPNVKSILINIFGGMARVDVIAEGIVQAHSEMQVNVPVVVRLEGTNLEDGERILAGATVNIIRAGDLGEAAQKAVAAASEGSRTE